MAVGKNTLPLGIHPPTDPQEGVQQIFDALQALKQDLSQSPGRGKLPASGAITKGQAVTISAGQLLRADKDVPRVAVGVALETVAAGARCRYVLLQGYSNVFSGLVAGTVYYLGNAGALLAAPPGAGIRQPIGVALSATEMLVSVSLP